MSESSKKQPDASAQNETAEGKIADDVERHDPTGRALLVVVFERFPIYLVAIEPINISTPR